MRYSFLVGLALSCTFVQCTDGADSAGGSSSGGIGGSSGGAGGGAGATGGSGGAGATGGSGGAGAGGGECPNTELTGAPAVCATADDGAACGARGTCEGGKCVFPEADTACDYDFATAPAGAYLVIACDHDLEGEEVILNEGITFESNGGSIRNGKLRINKAKISGQLLNPSLVLNFYGDGTLNGGAGTLIDSTFHFNKDTWGMQEGEVTDEVALKNRQNLRMAFDQVGGLGGTRFIIGELDVLLDVHSGPYEARALRPADNFHLDMCDKTHLRVQSNAEWEYSIIAIKEKTNVHISGGHLWGDRYTHDYEGGGSHPQDQGFGIEILGGVDIVVENISANQFIGDGLVVGAAERRYDDGSPKEDRQYSANVTIRDCVFDDNRRNGLALTDVAGAVLERLTVSNTANGDKDVDGRSAGVTPRYGLDIEPFQPALDDGTDTLRILEEVTDVIIRDSTFTNNYQGDIDFFKCHRVEAYGNTFGGGVGDVAAFDVSVHDNIFKADRADRGIGINVKPKIRDNGVHFVRDWKIYNNQISGFSKGMQIGGENQQVYGNTIEDFQTGIFLLTGVNCSFTDNTLSSTQDGSMGFQNFTNITLTGTISGGSVTVQSNPARFKTFNVELQSSDVFSVDGVEFTSSSKAPVIADTASYLTVSNCTADAFEQVNSGPGVTFTNNTVR